MATAGPVVIAGTIVATGAALLAGAGVILSREMSWDLLFNLAGAWHLANGHVAHVDFHDPVGQLSFQLTQLGFWLVGPTVRAFIAGDVAAAAIVFIAATAASPPRLSPAAATAFMLFTSLMVLMPINFGGDVTDFTFAMSYNHLGWATISVLSLLLFVPRRTMGPGIWIDAALGGLLMVALYHLKITYFVAALALLAVAFVMASHIHHRAWAVAAILVAAVAVAPWNWPYLANLAEVAAAPGSISSYLVDGYLTDRLHASADDLALCGLLAALAVALWAAGQASWRLPMAVGVLIVASLFLLAFNTQAEDLPLTLVACFVLYDCLRRSAFRRLAAILLAFPLWVAGTAATSLVAYAVAAQSRDDVLLVERTSLRGLAVPAGDIAIPEGEEIDQDDYVATILEAATLLRNAGDGGQGVVLFDQVNPLPFVLGQPPQRGARLWLDLSFPWPEAEAMFANVRYILVPRHPTYAAVRDEALRRYRTFMAEHFRHRRVSPNWLLFSRDP